MDLPNKICEDCHNKCEHPCAALIKLVKVVLHLNREDKKELLKVYSKELELIDAEPDKHMEELGNKVIDKFERLHFIRDYEIKIGYVRSYEKKRTVNGITFGSCMKVNDIFKAYLPFDFIVTFYDPNIDTMNDNQLKILMLHELSHIGIGERGFKINPHDIQDFYRILRDYGLDWNEFDENVIDILE